MNDGGVCGIFDLIEELKFAFANDKELQERILTSIKPDCLLVKQKSIAEKQALQLKFSILKITNKIAKQGKSVSEVFRLLD